MDLKTIIAGFCCGCRQFDKFLSKTPSGAWRCDGCRAGALPVYRRNGYTLIELLVVIGMIASFATLVIPTFLSYLRMAEVKAGAAEVRSALSQARSIAIKTNGPVCATTSTSKVTFWSEGCGATFRGEVRFATPVTIAPSAPSQTFTYLGASATEVDYRVTSIRHGTTLTVRVRASGRICVVEDTNTNCATAL